MKFKEFLNIPGYLGKYGISKNGEVCSYLNKSHDGRLLKQWTDNSGYLSVGICINRKVKTFTVHRLMGLTFLGKRKKGQEINHINGIKTDNRLSNLEYCEHYQNRQFKRPYKNSSSKYKGVFCYKKGSEWIARIMSDGKRHTLGHFKSEIEAAMAYDKKAKELHGKYAWLNCDHFMEVD